MKPPNLTIGLLGLVTIAAYGAWYYSFGVLLDPILADTGWPETWLATSFSVGGIAGSIGGIVGGRLIDRHGSRPGFALGAALSTTGLWVASAAGNPLVFAAGAVLGGASLQALGFYHITQTTAARVAPDRPARAIAVLTIYGAFSSTIYLPLANALVQATGWRVTVRVLATATAAVLVAAAMFVREPPDPARQTVRGGLAGVSSTRTAGRVAGGVLGGVLEHPQARRFVAAAGLIGFGVGTVLVYQVPLMVAAGLPAATAAWLAGARGGAQALGRVPLSPVVTRLGARRSVRVSFALITAGIAVLALAGNLVTAGIYVLVAGVGIGATSPLLGIYATELFDQDRLGTSMGVVTMAFGLSGAAGPAVAGILGDQTGSRWPGVVLASAAALVAVALLGPRSTPDPARRPARSPAPRQRLRLRRPSRAGRS